ncbi:MAG: bifunctional serine/threonine-protein kinase/universal stress protein [Alphaproteobacteria bacterium]|nr:bifunctional serine/threonine-protein kinase/universal stress protein [Alphaproteobacteria bacterium]
MPHVGGQIGGFRVGERLHSGGMAILYEASHPDHDIPLLVKVPRVAEGEDPAAIVGFEMEQLILARLSGPHVPRFIATGHEPVPWIAMERIEGASLLPRLRELPLPPEEVASLGAAIADALDSLHRQGCVHLDIKPSNILIAKADGRAVLVDFGLAHHAHLPDLMAEEFRLPYGTAPYMAPEQVMGIRADPAADIFALGAMLYFYATNVRPFGDPQSLKALKQRIWSDPVPPRAREKTTPPWLQEIILRCMEVEPARRYPSAAQVALALRHPEQVALTARAGKLSRDPWGQRLRRRFNPEYAPVLTRELPGQAAADAPIVAMALDLDSLTDDLSAALRRSVQHVMSAFPGARLACLNVLKLNLIRPDTTLDEQGRNKHLGRLIELRHWAAPLQLPEARLTHHVLEAVDPAAALVEFAEVNRVDHLVLGARGDSVSRRVLGSVSAEVARDAPCSVTVVRVRA